MIQYIILYFKYLYFTLNTYTLVKDLDNAYVDGCEIDPFCNYCNAGLDEAREKYGLIVFIISSVMALIAIAVGLLLPVSKNNINEWIATGFLLGGLITLFVGTARFYADMTRILRPIVILIELAIVIYLAYKKLKK
ncbi:MAG: hypothetical protein KKF46_02995 [Nanoarchaeota archaeon]|nr:hypothetical protein [Nanoarchaeota archaeon]MBU1321300.1 hypothetical protein [Nanoarchaeota archaeon]MBU2441863.1 hypothetical protein [Nanoarchaeota archaeon]